MRPFTSSDFLDALRLDIRDYFHADMRDLGVRLVRLNGNFGIIKCSCQHKAQMIQLLKSLKMIRGIPVVITTSSTSGTLHGVYKRKMKSS